MTEHLSSADLEALENDYCVAIPLTCEKCRREMKLGRSGVGRPIWQCPNGHAVLFDPLEDGDPRVIALVNEVRAWRESHGAEILPPPRPRPEPRPVSAVEEVRRLRQMAKVFLSMHERVTRVDAPLEMAAYYADWDLCVKLAKGEDDECPSC